MRLLTAILFASSAFAQTSGFPSAIDTDAFFRIQVNGVQTTLSAPLTAGSGTASVTSCAGIIANTYVTIDQEITTSSGCSGTVLSFGTAGGNCTSGGRGCDGTTAASHAGTAPVSLYIAAGHDNSLRSAVEAIENALGVSLINTKVALQTNGFPNSSQSTLNLVPGANITITNTSGGNVAIASTGGGTLSATNIAAALNGTGGGIAQAQTVTVSPAVLAYTDGLTVSWTPTNPNSGAGTTLAVSGLAPAVIVRAGGASLLMNDLTTTAKATAIYNLTQSHFELQNPQTASSGGVTSVGLTMPGWLTVGGSPVTSSGVLGVTAATGQTSHLVIGTCGSATAFSPCSLVAADIPTLNQSTTGNAGTATALAGTPTLCSTGQAPTGILASGNATGCAALSGGGTVTSVGLALPGWFTVSGSPVTGAGSLTGTAATGQTSHQVIGTCGTATAFTPCALVAADIPTLNQNTTGTAAALTATPTLCSTGQAPTGVLANGNATGCAALSGGGTVTSVAQTVPSWLSIGGSPVTGAGTLAITPATGQTSHQVIGTCGTATSFSPCALVPGDVPTLNQSTTGSSASTIESFTVGTGGVTINTLVITDNSNPAKVVAATGTGAYGIAQATVASTGTVNVGRTGQFLCVADTGGATAGDLVIAGSVTVIDCKDSGQTSSSAISISTRIVGVFLTSAIAGATATVELLPAHFGTLVSGGGTVTVVGAGSLASTAIVTGGGSQTAQTPSSSATVDSSGNIVGTSVSATNAGVNGLVSMGAGTGVAIPPNRWGWTGAGTTTTSWFGQSPNAVPTANQVMLFGAPTGNISTWTWTGISGSGSFCMTTSCVMTTPNLGTPSAVNLTNATAASAPLATLATQAADTVDMNATGGSASPTAVAMPTCTTGADLYNTSTHSWSCVSTGGGGAPTFPTNPQTATYQVVTGDFSACKVIPVASGTFTITLVASGSQPTNGQCIWVVNYGSGVVTIARSGQNINGGTANLTLNAASATAPTGAFIDSDGTNYFGQLFGAPSSSTPGTSAAVNLTAVTVSANVTTDQALQELSLSAGALNTANLISLLHGSGIFTIATLQTPTLTFKVKLCTVSGCGSGTVATLASLTTTATVAATNNIWNVELRAGTAATGASGNLMVHGFVAADIGASSAVADSVFNDTNTAVSSNINLAAALFVDFTVSTSAGNAGNSFTSQIAALMPQTLGAATVTSVTGDGVSTTTTVQTGAVVLVPAQAAKNTFPAGPVSGANAALTQRALVAADLNPVTRLCAPYIAPVATVDGIGNNTSGNLGHGATTNYYFGVASTAGYCLTTGAATAGTIDGTNIGARFTFRYGVDAGAISGTWVLAACPVSEFTVANVGGITNPCSNSPTASKVLFTTPSGSLTSGSVEVTASIEIEMTADTITAGNVRVSPLGKPEVLPASSATSLVTGGTALTGSAYYIYTYMQWATSTTGTVTCLGTTTTSSAVMCSVDTVWGPTIN